MGGGGVVVFLLGFFFLVCFWSVVACSVLEMEQKSDREGEEMGGGGVRMERERERAELWNTDSWKSLFVYKERKKIKKKEMKIGSDLGKAGCNE